MSAPIYYCDLCRKEAAYKRDFDDKVAIECHGGMQLFDRGRLPEPEPYPVDRGMQLGERDRLGNLSVYRCFAPDQPDHLRQIRNVMKFLQLPAAILTLGRLVRMEERELTDELHVQGVREGFNMGICCEIHPWLPNIRILYQDGPSEDDEYWDGNSAGYRTKRDVSYRNKIDDIKFGDASKWPSKYAIYFPKPKSDILKEITGVT